ncbi:FAD/NAD(P)-binding protein [Paracoccus homiensis]|uniref:FAD/NAD(P)-binding protein n=1 Tax=Paracoccus homiensis TaxID=364199 RepID=UPI00398CC2FE
MPKAISRLAVIGCGPRALGALEALALRQSPSAPDIHVDIFDPHPAHGAGPNFDPAETDLCQLNIPVRALDLGKGIGFCSVQDWLGDDDAEGFPARSRLGDYLMARFKALTVNASSLRISTIGASANDLRKQDAGWIVTCDEMRHGPYDAVLMTPGQPATRDDPQLSAWRDHATSVGAGIASAYPARDLLTAAKGWGGRNVAIRGLGLSTLDVLRVLTLGLGGRFQGDRYLPSGAEPARILPFSLTGRAPFPKPATTELDAGFDPTVQETHAFRAALASAMKEPPERAPRRLASAFVAPTLRLMSGRATSVQIQDWLGAECDDPDSQDDRDTATALRDGIAEASGQRPASIGYTIGQLSRKWQNQMRQGFNPALVDAGTAAALVGFDNGLKRYSYGPPIQTARQMLTLIRAGLVDPRKADDPEIRMIDSGWQLIEGDDSAVVSVMVDAVLPSPDLSRIADPMIRALVEHGRMVPVTDGMGAQLHAGGQVADEHGRTQDGLYLLGRLGLGSVIAVDSLHDCFGAAADRWADAVLRHMKH